MYAACYCYYLNWWYLIGFVASKQRSRPNVIFFCSSLSLFPGLDIFISPSSYWCKISGRDEKKKSFAWKSTEMCPNVTICKFSAFSLNGGGHHHYAETISFCSYYYYYFCFILLLRPLFVFFCSFFFSFTEKFWFLIFWNDLYRKEKIDEMDKESESQRNVLKDVIWGRERDTRRQCRWEARSPSQRHFWHFYSFISVYVCAIFFFLRSLLYFLPFFFSTSSLPSWMYVGRFYTCTMFLSFHSFSISIAFSRARSCFAFAAFHRSAILRLLLLLCFCSDVGFFLFSFAFKGAHTIMVEQRISEYFFRLGSALFIFIVLNFSFLFLSFSFSFWSLLTICYFSA